MSKTAIPGQEAIFYCDICHKARPLKTMKWTGGMRIKTDARVGRRTMTAPHPQRCETCNHFLRYVIHCKKYDCHLPEESIATISFVGCASHSSAVSEREKVLNFYKWLIELSKLELVEEQQEFTDGVKEVLFEFEKRFPELRQQGGRE
jgi:hypothetical protein